MPSVLTGTACLAVTLQVDGISISTAYVDKLNLPLACALLTLAHFKLVIDWTPLLEARLPTLQLRLGSCRATLEPHALPVRSATETKKRCV